MLIALLLNGAGPAEAQRPPSRGFSPPTEERRVLGAAFVGGHARLEALLHADLVVQPPAPDSALRGSAAIAYLTGLARHTRVSESWLEPQVFTREGVFLLEQGTWVVRSRDQALGSRYHLRWRRTPAGWKVVLWRWTAFR